MGALAAALMVITLIVLLKTRPSADNMPTMAAGSNSPPGGPRAGPPIDPEGRVPGAPPTATLAIPPPGMAGPAGPAPANPGVTLAPPALPPSPPPMPPDNGGRNPGANPRQGMDLAGPGAPGGVITEANAPRAGPAPNASADPAGRPDLGGSAVGERDLGLAFVPGAKVVPSAGTRVRDPSGSETVSAVLSTGESAGRLEAYYRAQLQAASGGAPVDTHSPGPGQLLLQTVNPSNGVNRAVLIAQGTGGAMMVTLVRASPPSGP